MAITAVHYFLVRDLFEKGLLPQHGALLEIGEANVYSDVAPAIADDIRRYVTDPARRDRMLERHAELLKTPHRQILFDFAKLFYEMFFSPAEIQAVDFGGTAIARKLDLNEPIQLDRKFDVSINHGTAEHIFNIAQVFRTMHEYTVAGGLMIHEDPFTGWIDHGFFNLQPTLFLDLAEFNQYDIQAMYIEDFNARSVIPITSRQDVYDLARDGKIAANTSLFVAYRKSLYDRPFQIPVQGYYRGALPKTGAEAWMSLR
jgi:hypothetical protein